MMPSRGKIKTVLRNDILQADGSRDMSRLPSAFRTFSAFHFVPLLCMQDKTRAGSKHAKQQNAQKQALRMYNMAKMYK